MQYWTYSQKLLLCLPSHLLIFVRLLLPQLTSPSSPAQALLSWSQICTDNDRKSDKIANFPPSKKVFVPSRPISTCRRLSGGEGGIKGTLAHTIVLYIWYWLRNGVLVFRSQWDQYSTTYECFSSNYNQIHDFYKICECWEAIHKSI